MKTNDKFSAGEQSLGYSYQFRFALLYLFKLPEATALVVEGDDDLELSEIDGVKQLGSLKHKSEGDRLTDLAPDFWKSVRIWLTRYKSEGRATSRLRFALFTTGAVSESSFLSKFLPSSDDMDSEESRIAADEILSTTQSKSILPIKADFDSLSSLEKQDFLGRITIFDRNPRIEDVPGLIIDQHFRTILRQFRGAVYERLEGWWTDLMIKLLTKQRTIPISGLEVSDKLASLNDEYKNDNLPITFQNKIPAEGVDPENDPRRFVAQLRALKVQPTRIQNAIVDYYRAFEQRSSWLRENVLIDGEVDEYEERLVNEWGRYRDVIFENMEENTTEEIMQKCGRELYTWAEMNTTHLRIRDRVSEPYVVRGSFHILANEQPKPRVYWHPLFLERLNSILTEVPA